jgi:hypothetical protein
MRNQHGDVTGVAVWKAGHGGNPERFVEIIEALMAAGGQLPERHP